MKRISVFKASCDPSTITFRRVFGLSFRVDRLTVRRTNVVAGKMPTPARMWSLNDKKINDL
jgi:hypothetical protein